MSDLAIIDAETGEIVQPPRGLFGTDEPGEVVRRAKAHADELAKVIKQRELFTVIGKKAYPYVEAWSLLGSMLGVFPVVDEVEPVEVDGVQGFRAAVRAVTRDGAVVGRSVAYCMRDEDTWKNRTHHALAGMAETRATSRALRKPLGFIVQLAGYSPTAAEEMSTSLGRISTREPGGAPSLGSPGAAPVETTPGEEDLPEPLKSNPDDPISDAMRRYLFRLKDERGMDDDQMKAVVYEAAGVTSRADLKRRHYEVVKLALNRWEPPPVEPEADWKDKLPPEARGAA